MIVNGGLVVGMFLIGFAIGLIMGITAGMLIMRIARHITSGDWD